MVREENRCVECGLPCIGAACRHHNVEVHYCDDCGEEGTEIVIDGVELCRKCATAALMDEADELSLYELARLLGHDVEAVD